jgi:hypothetical protein
MTPLRIKDAHRLLVWIVSNNVTIIRFVINLLIITIRVLKYVIKNFYISISLFAIGFYTFNTLQLGQLWIILTGFYLIFNNLSDKKREKGELSAYSIFNEGFQRIMGDLDADQIDQQLRNI